GLEADVAVRRQQKPERREIGVGRRVGETVNALGQRGREIARSKRIARQRVGGVDAEQRAGESSALPRQKLQLARLRRKAATLGEDGGLFSDRGLHVLPVSGADEPDRNGVGRRRGESRQERAPWRTNECALPRIRRRSPSE